MTFKFNGKKKPLNALHDDKTDFYNYYQTEKTTNTQ